MEREREGGFSLVELLVAMVVTLVVTGAIYGLMAGGQSAFRREPELTDRQQNIRLAMDMIMRDVTTAGANMPDPRFVTSWPQIFTTSLDGASIATCKDNAGTTVTCPTAPSGAKTDEMEILANPNNYEAETACPNSTYGGGASHVRIVTRVTHIANPNAVAMIFLDNGKWTLRNINNGITTTAPVGGTSDCSAGGTHLDLKFSSPEPSQYNTANLCSACAAAPGNACGDATCVPKTVLAGEIVRYRIRAGTDGVPNLERFSSGLAGNFVAGRPQFQVVARGIDDLQVQYAVSTGTVTDNAPAIVGGTYDSIVQRVTVTLSARSEAKNLTGMTTPVSGPAALRGTLTSSATPRAALVALMPGPALRAAGQPSPWQ